MKDPSHDDSQYDVLSIYSFTDLRKKSQEFYDETKSSTENQSLETMASSRIGKEKFDEQEDQLIEIQECIKQQDNVLQMQLDEGQRLHEMTCEILLQKTPKDQQPNPKYQQPQPLITPSVIGVVLGTVIGCMIHFSF